MQRLYIDSRDRAAGSNEDFQVSLPIPINVERESVAVLDTVLVPNSFYNVTQDVDDRLYVIESSFQQRQRYRVAVIAPGYYDVESFAVAVGAALNSDRHLIMPYTVTFDPRLGRYRIYNELKGAEENAVLLARESLQRWPPLAGEEPLFDGFERENLRDAYRQLGLVSLPSAWTNKTAGLLTMTSNSAPTLQSHFNLFIKGNLGVPGACFGPRGSMDILRRVVMQAPTMSINFDNHGTHFDNIRIAPGTISTLRFRLCGFDGKLVDLQGQPWSFSLVIYPA